MRIVRTVDIIHNPQICLLSMAEVVTPCTVMYSVQGFSETRCTPVTGGHCLGRKGSAKHAEARMNVATVSKRSMTWRILYLKMVIFIRKLMINHKNSQTTPTSQGTFPISKSCTRSPDASCSALRVELQNRNRNVVRRKHCASKDRQT